MSFTLYAYKMRFLEILMCIFLAVGMFNVNKVFALTGGYWEKFLPPKKIYTVSFADFPYTVVKNGPSIPGSLGATHFMVQSLSGLAAKAVKEGKSDSMVWIDAPGNMDYANWFADTSFEGKDKYKIKKNYT